VRRVTPLQVAVAEAVRAIPEGRAASYGYVAHEAGFPGRHRAVGAFLRDHGDDVPWWRVVAAGGRLAAPDPGVQAQLLRAEGVVVRDGRVARAAFLG
jgi:methylated-DNA-protein-cysteine methyltransferase-like protein